MRNRLNHLSVKPRRVEIEWVDSSGESGWQDAGQVLDSVEHPDYLTCLSAGYLIHETDERVTIALSYTVDVRTGLHQQYGEVMTIPRVAIVEIRDLRR